MDSLGDQVSLGLGQTNYAGGRWVDAVFVDNIACCYPYAGQGTLFPDDSADPSSNWNNATWGGARYAMVRLGWPALLEAGFFQHEVGHNLGAVQDSAPHSSGAAHCYEGSDVMCYDDGGPWFQSGGAFESNCLAMADGQDVWDCGKDDYYDPSPANGSYLHDHWNIADSGWLVWSVA